MTVPRDKAEKDLWRKQRAAARRLFFNDWDPIGIKDFDGPEDEYNTYADKALALAREGADDSEIENFLTWAREVHMGLGPAPNNETEQKVIYRLRLILDGD